jgi:hypothetical protein
MPVRSPNSPKLFVSAIRGETEIHFEMKENYGIWKVVPPVDTWISDIEGKLQDLISFNLARGR